MASTEVTRTDLEDWIARFGAAVLANRDHLTALDSAIGDADHGGNMARGMNAVADAMGTLDPDAAIGAMFRTVGMTLVSKVGGASGPLYGTFFIRFGGDAADAATLDGASLAAALDAGVQGVVARGKAQAGDKTMVDAMLPAMTAMHAALDDGATVGEATAAAAAGAVEGRDATVPMVARKGRASYLGERSAGHLDPGAASTCLLFEALAASLGSDG